MSPKIHDWVQAISLLEAFDSENFTPEGLRDSSSGYLV